MLFAFALAIVCSSAPSPSTPSPSTPVDAHRFAPRAYLKRNTPVVVDARSDMMSLQTALGANDVASQVEQLLAKTGRNVSLTNARIVRHHSTTNLVALEFAGDVDTTLLASIAHDLEAADEARAYPVLARESGRAFYDDALIVTTKPNALDRVLATLTAKFGTKLLRISNVPDTALIEVGAAFAHDAVDASAALSRVDGVVSAEPDLYRELRATSVVPNDPLFASQWHLSRQNDSVPGTGQIFASDAWDTTMGDPSVLVAVFDTGIDVTHPDLAPNVATSLMFDAVDGDDDPSPACSAQFDGAGPTNDCPMGTPFRQSHGTAVSGVVAAVANNGIGVSGVCPQCTLLPVRILGDDAQSSLAIAEAFVRAVDDGAAVINNSWGPGFSLFFPLSSAEQDAFDYARSHGRGGLGTVIVFASGNDEKDVVDDGYASNPYVVTVSASTNVDDWALYSNFGKQVSVCAPSQGLPAQQDGFPDDDFGIVTTDIVGADGYSSGDDDDGFNGTSAASPVAAGVAALVLSVNPSLTAEQVRLVLTQSADKITADKFPWSQAGFSDDTQHFLFDYDDAGHSNAFGYGRVNAARAVSLAQNAASLEGALCSDPQCTFCSAEERCLTRCTQQSDCVDGSICDAALGACELPRATPTGVGAPCSADCAACTPTLDTEFNHVSVCTTTCNTDSDCAAGFDCRLTSRDGPKICAVGDRGAGEPADFFHCANDAIGSALVVSADDGKQLCGDVCFGDSPGACPYGFSCRQSDCTCTAGSQNQCFVYSCTPASLAGPNTFPFDVCEPNAGFAVECQSDVDCQLGDYCKDGACKLDDRAGCDICKPCSSDSDCTGRGTCIGLRESNVGQCAWECDDVDGCPGDSACREVSAGGSRTIHICLSPEGGTDAATRCDPSYTCHVPCRDDVPCPSGQQCSDGACVPSSSSPNPSTPGAPSVPGISGGGCGCASSSTHDAWLDGVSLLAVGFGFVLRGRTRMCRGQQRGGDSRTA